MGKAKAKTREGLMAFADGLVDDSRGEEERPELECEKKGGMQDTPYSGHWTVQVEKSTGQLHSYQFPLEDEGTGTAGPRGASQRRASRLYSPLPWGVPGPPH